MAMKIHTSYGEMDLEIDGNRAKLVRGHGDQAVKQAGPAPGQAGQKALPVSNLAPAPTFDSKLEAQYAQQLAALKQVKEIQGYWYHPLSLRLPGKQMHYTPDFLVQALNGHLLFYEVKGWSKNLRDGLTHLRVAAGLVPWATFVLVTKEKGRWCERVIQ